MATMSQEGLKRIINRIYLHNDAVTEYIIRRNTMPTLEQKAQVHHFAKQGIKVRLK